MKYDAVRFLWKTIRQDRLAFFGVAVLFCLVAIALLAPLVATHDPNEMNHRVEGTVFWYRDGEWVIQESVGEWTLNAVTFCYDGDTAFAVGNHGEVLKYSAGSWEKEEVPTTVHLQDVAFGENLVVVVGESGTILEKRNGEWIIVNTPVENELFAVSIAPGTQKALVAGTEGTVLRRLNDTWELVDTGATEDLLAVSFPAEDTGFIVGRRNVIFHYDGETLSRQMVMGFRDLYDVHAPTTDMALAVGERGTILHYTGTAWSAMYGPEARDLRGVRLIEEDKAVAVGSHGVIIRMDQGQWMREDTGYRRHLRGIDAFGGMLIASGTDPYVNSLARPSVDHWFGTTHLGRDIYSQVVYGSRAALTVGFLAAIMVAVIGTNVGLFAGYFKGRVDGLLMRIVDIMYALPLEPFAMILVLLSRPGLTIIIFAVGLLTWRTTARIIRSQVLSLAARPFVKAARIAGASDLRILYVHIAPNILPLAFLQLAVSVAFAITAEATLSFLGLGPPRIYSWGTILHEARLSGAWRTAWWWIIPPGVLIMITVVSVFFISRALEVLTNPRLGKR